jgi:hypothetical protein
MEDWNENNWQGRRKEQVEFSGKALFYGVIGLIIVVSILKLTSFFK